jgi:hypothetical protein
MLARKIFLTLFILSALLNSSAYAEQPPLKSFVSGSYQQILKNNAHHPFMLSVWSVTCPSCLKDMELLGRLHKDRPGIKMIFLATDDISEATQIQSMLKKFQLSEIENWVYADENTQMLQYEIDPKWYGELPRTYFFNAAHQREGVSGALSKEDFEARLAKIHSKFDK